MHFIARGAQLAAICIAQKSGGCQVRLAADECRSVEWLGEAGFANVRTVEAPELAPRLILATKPNVS